MHKIAVSMVAGGLLAISASAATTMKGWISDASCGSGNASSKAESRECAERCLKGGAPAVFVSEADQKVYKVADTKKVLDHVKYKVAVTGDVKGDTLTITEIKKAE